MAKKKGQNQSKGSEIKEPAQEVAEKSIFELLKRYLTNDETSSIVGDAVMSACNFTPEDVETVNNHGLNLIPDMIDNMSNPNLNHDFTGSKFISNLFSLGQNALEQFPISFYADIVSSKEFKQFDKDRKNEFFSQIFEVIGFDSLEQFKDDNVVEPYKVAYNHKAYRTIWTAYNALNKEKFKDVDKANSQFDKAITTKLNVVLDRAPELRDQLKSKKAEVRNEAIQKLRDPYAKHDGNLKETTNEVLDYFTTTKDLNGKTIPSLGLGENFNEYSAETAKAIYADYEYGAFLRAAEHAGYINREKDGEDLRIDVEHASIVSPEQKETHKFVSTSKSIIANFVKPQNLLKLGFRRVAINAIQHTTEGVIPGLGAAVGLAMKLGECCIKSARDKKNAKKIWKDAIPDFTRGVVTVGASFIPFGAIAAAPIGTVASIVVRGMQAAHQEGLKAGQGYWKRVAEEFKTKNSKVSLVASGIGSMIGVGAREWIDHHNPETGIGFGEKGTIGDFKAFKSLFNHSDATQENDVELPTKDIYSLPELDSDSNEFVDGMTSEEFDQFGTPNAMEGDPRFVPHETYDAMKGDPRFMVHETPNAMKGDPRFIGEEPTEKVLEENPVETMTETEIQQVDAQLSYVEQYLRDHPGATVDKNGWVQNADGSYARNEVGKMFGVDDRVFRNLTENETLDEHGNIIDKAPTVEEQNSYTFDENIPGSMIRSAEELAKIDAMQQQADNARMFNMLPSDEQKSLIDLQAQMAVAKNVDETTYNRLKETFDKQFNSFTEKEQELRLISSRANIPGTAENIERDAWQNSIAGMPNGPEKTEAINSFCERYGEDMGTDPETGVRIYARFGGELKQEIPSVDPKTLAEQGFRYDSAGKFWVKASGTGETETLLDTNGNGYMDSGDTCLVTHPDGSQERFTVYDEEEQTINVTNFNNAFNAAVEKHQHEFDLERGNTK